MKLPVSSKYISLLATAVVLLALYTVGCISFPNFGSLRVGVNLVGDNAFLGVAAVGATFVILSGGIDLSVGAVVAFTSTLIASLVGNGVHPLAAISASLLVGALFGTVMGCLIRWFELPPFLVTLAGTFLARGMGFVVHRSRSAASLLPSAHYGKSFHSFHRTCQPAFHRNVLPPDFRCGVVRCALHALWSLHLCAGG
jgi:ribose/xylose/arabinose/galactoside ABC-type transport system permease subunit